MSESSVGLQSKDVRSVRFSVMKLFPVHLPLVLNLEQEGCCVLDPKSPSSGAVNILSPSISQQSFSLRASCSGAFSSFWSQDGKTKFQVYMKRESLPSQLQQTSQGSFPFVGEMEHPDWPHLGELTAPVAGEWVRLP